MRYAITTTEEGWHTVTQNQPYKEISGERLGDKVLRRHIRPRKELCPLPNIPLVVRVVQDVVQKTPFVPMFLTLVILWLAVAAGMYLLERGTTGAAIVSHSEALWWSLASVETMGTPYEPITGLGRILGGVWAVLGVMLFWGTIIASVTSYFMTRRRQATERIIDTIQYNLGELQHLTTDELDALKEVTMTVLDRQRQKTDEEQHRNQ
ncbi:two pore domain potassium channel family protein [Chloroflexota bacterium]